MRKVFTDEVGHKFFDTLMMIKSTIIVLIQVYNTITKKEEIVAFASLAKI